MWAETKKFEVDVLLDSRLAPDQFNFTRQVQILCDTAKKCNAQLTGKEATLEADGRTFRQIKKEREESTE